METIEINGLDINVVQNITGFKITNARLIERRDDGLKWGGQVQLMSGDVVHRNRLIQIAINDNTFMSFDELDAEAQSVIGKNYSDLTVTESHQIQGTVMATKMIVAINATDAGVSITDITTLVVSIVTALN